MFNILFQIFSLQLQTSLSCSVMPCAVYCLSLPPLHTFKCVPILNHSLSLRFLLHSFPHFCSWHFIESLFILCQQLVPNVYKVIALVFLYTASIYIIWCIYQFFFVIMCDIDFLDWSPREQVCWNHSAYYKL